jgi:uncharacterized protein YlxW (UPF0749 family)
MEEKLRNGRSLISIALVCVALGVMLALQLRSTGEYDILSTRNSRVRVEDLTLRLQQAYDENDLLEAQNAELQDKLNKARSENEAFADMQEDLVQAQMAAGFTKVRGAGVILTLNDRLRSLQAGEDPNYLLVQDADLLRIVNELKASGAEAISVNNERIITTSEIRCVGTTILVNTKKITPPFVIAATGDPQGLEAGITMKGGYLEALRFSGIQINLQKVEQIEIPGYNRPFHFEHTHMAENT